MAAPAQMMAPAMNSAGVRAFAMIPVSMNLDDSVNIGSAASPGAES